jgi:cytochrome c
MKRVLLSGILSIALLASCQKKAEETQPAEQPAQPAQPEQSAQPAQPAQPEQQKQEQPSKPSGEQKPAEQKSQGPAKDMTALAQQKGCFACHDINTKKVGPAYKDVAKKFAGQSGVVDELAKRIKNGGVGNWGQVPMPPQNVTDEEAKELAQWILSLK